MMNSESGGEKVTQVETELKNNGYDLKAMGINAWGYTQDKELLWTTIDIHSVSDGTMVPTMRYNNSSGSYNGIYTVWWCKVDETSNQYPYLDTGHKNEYSESSVIKEAAKKKDFNQMVQWY
ncbi:hypothetical protein [Eubacterium aggregans]|uniref:hypothetical protein n=1 Tax=Eubacterium aggregans TaxID=81409 RepID=UPI003F341550